MQDEQLETWLAKLKTSKNSHNKLLNSKRAATRINELKTEYNELCKALDNKSDDKSDDEDVSITDIISNLKKMDESIDETHDMREMIDNFIKYKSLLKNLNIESDQIKNEISKINEKNKKIVMQKLNVNDIL